MKVLGLALAWALALTWGFGQLVRDATYLGQFAFYIPTPLVAGTLLLTALVCARRGARGQAAGAGLAALVPLGVLLFVEHRWTPPAVDAPTGETLRVVHWNVRKGRYWDRVLPQAVAQRADLYVFSEPPWGQREREVAAVRDFTAPPVRLGEMALVARGSLGKPQGMYRNEMQAVLVPWTVDGHTLSLLLVDLQSDLRMPRQPHLQLLRQLIAERRPDLVLGDLNAPRRSRALTPPPPGYVHGYDAAGRGWSATWRMPVPLWSIDQCLVGPRLRVVRYALRGDTASDHRMQVIDLAAYHEATP